MLWVTDITEHPTSEGAVYCCAVLDVYSRMIVGWSIADHMRAELVVDALQMACWRRRPPPGTICHSDRGAQYTSWTADQIHSNHPASHYAILNCHTRTVRRTGSGSYSHFQGTP